MAGHDFPPGEPAPRVIVQEVMSETYSSGLALARALGHTVVEPSWWPGDVGEIGYDLVGLDRPRGQRHYEIGATRAEGVPILVVGFLEAAWAGRSPRDWLDGEWSEPPELAQVRGLIGRVGDPPRLQVVVFAHELAIQLIGYNTEAEIMNAVRSLRNIDPD